MYRLTIWGAARTVTGSRHLLQTPAGDLLLEAGLYQGPREETRRRNHTFPFDLKRIKAVLLSHAHLDHCGTLPNLVKHGYDGPIYATPATAHLATLVMLDAAHVQEENVRYLNRHRKPHEPPLEPLYTAEDALRAARRFVPIPYDMPFEPLPGVQARFVEAGHILGSAAVVLDLDARPRPIRLWFSGDIGRRHLPILRDPVLPQAADWLLMECTYGHKPHRDPRLAYDEIRAVATRTFDQGGKLVIPAFAVGRTQTLVYLLHTMMRKKELPEVPIYVDSPMAVEASMIYRMHPECFDEEVLQMLRQGVLEDVLGFGRVRYIRSVEESKALNDQPGPMVILSTSGMLETGRILHHLKHTITDPKNTIMLVSWTAPHTLGRRLADGATRVRILGREYPVRAQVVTIGDLSAHAGRDLLLEYVQATQETLKGVALVHGEPHAAQALMQALAEQGITQVRYPQEGEGWDLTP